MDDILFKHAQAALKRGDKKAAQSLLDEVIIQDPRNEAAWILLAEVVPNRNEAVDCLRQALRANPNNLEVKAKLESLLTPLERQLEDAAAIIATHKLDQAPPAPPRLETPADTALTADLELPVGVALRDHDPRADEAMKPERKNLLDLLKIDPQNEAAWLKLAEQALNREEEIDSLKHALAINPYNTIARLRLNKLLAPQGS